jgi:uroporphyrinogen decarboxylase
MAELTAIERTNLLFEHKKPDRIGLYEHFWGDTYKDWVDKGKIQPGTDFTQHFNYDMTEAWVFNFAADLDFKSEVVAEDEDTITVKDQNYAILRRHKKHDTTPEHVGFTVDSREKWDELIKPRIKADKNRINFEGYRNAKKYAAENNKYFMWSGVNVFELIHPVCGHVNMLMAMLDDPEWVTDMCETYSEATVGMWEILFEREGLPDGIWFYEDMGFKDAPFMSPDMYKEFIYPAHRLTCDFAHSRNLKVMMHSCGFVEPLLPHMVEAGIDGLQVIEVKAGMDLLRIYKNFGEKIALMGGIDVRTLYSNDRKIIDAELESKIPTVKQGFAYSLHSDHSIPKTVEYETYKYFIEKGLELGTYK